jgi:hypothetical protein
MGASNYAVCPKCWKEQVASEADALQRVLASYGKVLPDEFLAAQARLTTTRKDDFDRTFREDFEIYNDNEGSVHVDYHGMCSKCGVKLAFELEKEIEC